MDPSSSGKILLIFNKRLKSYLSASDCLISGLVVVTVRNSKFVGLVWPLLRTSTLTLQPCREHTLAVTKISFRTSFSSVCVSKNRIQHETPIKILHEFGFQLSLQSNHCQYAPVWNLTKKKNTEKKIPLIFQNPTVNSCPTNSQ